MSGTRQHFVPRFMMRGFIDPASSPNEITHVYRQGGSYFATNIKNIGLQNEFYGEEGPDSLDERLTESEGRFANFINEIRTAPQKDTLNSRECAALCSHLAMRTRHLRLVSTEVIERFIEKIATLYQVPENRDLIFNRLFQGDVGERRRKMEEALVSNRDFQTLTPERQSEALDFILGQPRLVLESMVNGVSNQMSAYLQALRQQIKLIVQNGHNKALHKDGALMEHEKKLGQLTWVTLETVRPLILGDFLLLVRDGKRSTLVNYLMAQESPEQVFLPLSSNRLLIGYLSTERQPSVNVAFLNRDVAANSYEHFVAAVRSDEIAGLCFHIGETLASEMVDIHKMMDETIKREMFKSK